ncbi:MAG: hypothetical protein OES46_11895 [Gammaproteobacteria bacterium]|nr:hypothetical protein [Gammaproteobacteria bacterium]
MAILRSLRSSMVRESDPFSTHRLDCSRVDLLLRRVTFGLGFGLGETRTEQALAVAMLDLEYRLVQLDPTQPRWRLCHPTRPAQDPDADRAATAPDAEL